MPRFNLPGPGNLRTPLEGIDLVADGINRVATLPFQVAREVNAAASRATDTLQKDISAPREQSERPIPPDVLISPIPKGLGHIVSGVIDTVKSGVGAVVGNVDGARQELENFVK